MFIILYNSQITKGLVKFDLTAIKYDWTKQVIILKVRMFIPLLKKMAFIIFQSQTVSDSAY